MPVEVEVHTMTQLKSPVNAKVEPRLLECGGRHVCIVKHNVGRGFCQHFGPIGLITTKFYSDSFSTKKHSLDYYHCMIWFKEPVYTGEPMRQQKNLVISGCRVEFY